MFYEVQYCFPTLVSVFVYAGRLRGAGKEAIKGKGGGERYGGGKKRSSYHMSDRTGWYHHPGLPHSQDSHISHSHTHTVTHTH